MHPTQNKIKSYIELLRLPDWVKNTFLFLPLFFAGELFEVDKLVNLLFGFFSFSFAASFVYIINDYRDRASDREHETKRHRPLAAGTVSVVNAFFIATLLVINSFVIATKFDIQFSYLLLFYILMNLAYSIRLKHIPILDIVIISVGFLLRIFAGGVAAQVTVSHWTIIMVFLLTLFMGLAKRRDDVLIFNESGKKIRKSIDGYNLEFVNAGMTMTAGIIIVAYILSMVSEEIVSKFHSRNLYLTASFVVVGIMRYMQLTFVEKKSASPTKILIKDRFIQLTLLAWILTFYYLIYW